MSLKLGATNFAFVHLTYVPFIAAAGELKTKPTQHTVQKLREIGIQPDALLCRADRYIPDDEREKISLFTNVPLHGVISMPDVDVIYKVPRVLHEQGLDEQICMKLQLLTTAGRPAALGHAGAGRTAPAARGHDRDVRQVHRPVGLVQVAQRSAAPRRHPQPCAGEDRVCRCGNADGAERQPARPLRRGAGARRLRQARRRRQDPRRQVRAREQDSLPRHLPGHAGGDDRSGAPPGGSDRRQQHRVRTRDAAPGDRADRRVAGPRRLDPEARRHVGPRRHDAPGRAEFGRQGRHAGAQDLRQRRHRAPPPPLRGQRRITSSACSRRAWSSARSRSATS